MKVLLIQPFAGYKLPNIVMKLSASLPAYPNLTLQQLAGICPEDCELEVVDENRGDKIDFENMDVLQHYVNEWKMWYLQAGFDPVTWTKGYQFLLSPFRVFRQAPDNQNRVKIESALKNFVGTTLDTLVNDPDEQIRVWLRFLERNRIPILTPQL